MFSLFEVLTLNFLVRNDKGIVPYRADGLSTEM